MTEVSGSTPTQQEGSEMGQLPEGLGRDRLRLWDSQYRLLWDSATATDPAYSHINTWVYATIDKPDGSRWSGQLFRSPNGVERFSPPDLQYLTTWPNPLLEVSDG